MDVKMNDADLGCVPITAFGGISVNFTMIAGDHTVFWSVETKVLQQLM
jgi:hypothetical protein